MKKILLMIMALMLAAGAQAAVSVRLEDGAALLDPQGGQIVPLGAYDDLIPLGEDCFAASAGGAYALMNGRGDLLTDAEYSDLRPAGSVIAACRNGLWGLIDRNGAVIAPFDYTKIVHDESGAFWALRTDPADQDSDELFLLDEAGGERSADLLVRRMAGEAACGRIAVQIGGLWGYCDARGRLAVPAEYESVGTFAAGLAPVVQGGKYGAVDADGTPILPALYDALEISAAGTIIASVTGEGVRVFSGEGDEIAFHPGGEVFAAAVGEGYALYEPDQARLFDSAGNEILSASAQAAFTEGLNGQILLSDGPWGDHCVSIAGTESYYQNLYPLGMAGERALYACMTVSASRYMNDLLGEMQLAVDMDSARWGVVDETGAVLIPAEYESVQYLGGDRLLTHIEGQWQMIDSAGKVYWSCGIRQSEEASF